LGVLLQQIICLQVFFTRKSEKNMILKVAGIIQNVETYTLRTDSLIADCVLGQGAALDWLRRAFGLVSRHHTKC
jgi:hypothetical protein